MCSHVTKIGDRHNFNHVIIIRSIPVTDVFGIGPTGATNLANTHGITNVSDNCQWSVLTWRHNYENIDVNVQYV